ncbi:DUF6986 family protein [Oerskovia flava]|uniref:DUF6986 family protein n=1 Tax=Oerskovia flava TaxID=2986422 RepID=UPI0022401BBA|nr:aldolase/citrate lyase family protein [Oerskovia sp. JB1-3-2]
MSPDDPGPVLGEDLLALLDDRLGPSDDALEQQYPGDDGTRQPVHTVYVPADRFHRGLVAQWGDEARATLAAAGGSEHLARVHGLSGELAEHVARLVDAKLEVEPIEDLRIDLEDGYGRRADATEDADTRAAARELAAAEERGAAPAFVGLRIKAFERATRRRGIRTLDLFLAELVAARAGASGGSRDGLPDGFVVTLAKVQSVAQVEAMATVCERLEQAHGLATGLLRFEVQVETPQAVLGADGRATVALMVHAGAGRVVGLHYGTYDYSASLGIAAEHQSADHPAADHAKAIMQLAAAGTRVRVSDGSTNVLPVGEPAAVDAAWALHGRLVRRALERGFYQGWDLHPAQLPSRFAATYAFYRRGSVDALRRLAAYTRLEPGGVLDEPATARALAWFVLRGIDCGALTETETRAGSGLDRAHLAALRSTGGVR